MTDQTTANYESPDPKEAPGDQESIATHFQSLDNLTMALAQSNLGGYTIEQLETVSGKGRARKAYQAEGQQASEKTRQASVGRVMPGSRRDKKLKARNAREAEEKKSSGGEPTEQAKGNDEAEHNETRKTRFKTGKLPLGFDPKYLDTLGNQNTFMNHSQIKAWIESVCKHLKSWVNKCLSKSANKLHVKAARNDPFAFVRTIVQEATYQHESSRLLGPLLGEVDECPTAFHVAMIQRRRLNFVQRTAMIACLIVRDGRRDGPFATWTNEKKLHRAAALLLISVIIGVKGHSGYFRRLLLGDKDPANTPEESETKPVMTQGKVKKISKVVNFPRHMSDRVNTALQEWKKRAVDCDYSFNKPRASETLRIAKLTGSVRQINKEARALSMMVKGWRK